MLSTLNEFYDIDNEISDKYNVMRGHIKRDFMLINMEGIVFYSNISFINLSLLYWIRKESKQDINETSFLNAEKLTPHCYTRQWKYVELYLYYYN
jgi:hypothetical protein